MENSKCKTKDPSAPISRYGVETALDTGYVVEGRFRIEHRASVGGTAKVYRATDLTNGAAVGLKVLYGDVADDQSERLEREAELL